MHAPAGKIIFGWQPLAARLCAPAALFACLVLDLRGCCEFRLPARHGAQQAQPDDYSERVLPVVARDERVGDFNLTGHGEEDVVVLCAKAIKIVVMDYLNIFTS